MLKGRSEYVASLLEVLPKFPWNPNTLSFHVNITLYWITNQSHLTCLTPSISYQRFPLKKPAFFFFSPFKTHLNKIGKGSLLSEHTMVSSPKKITFPSIFSCSWYRNKSQNSPSVDWEVRSNVPTVCPTLCSGKNSTDMNLNVGPVISLLWPWARGLTSDLPCPP